MDHLPACSFSLFQIGGGNNDHTPTQILAIPHLLSLLATNSWNGKVIGLTPLQQQYAQKYGPGSYVPNVFIQYWSMRLMAYSAGVVFLLALWGLWLIRRKTLTSAKWFLVIATWAVILPFVMNTTGWLLTESGRQPWIVQGLMLTRNGVSPSVSTTDIVISLVVFVLLYLALALVDLLLMLRFARKELAQEPAAGDGRTPRCRRCGTRSGAMTLAEFWFIVIAVLWTGFFVLEGFDFGVGMLHGWPGGTRPAAARRSTRSGRCRTATRCR